MTSDSGAVLVTGAGGFIGSAVVRTLVTHGSAVTALLGPPGSGVIDPSGTSARHADIRDLAALMPLLDGIQVVVHLAGSASVQESFTAPAEYASQHVVGTATLLEAARRSGVKRIVHISSAEVYGRPNADLVDERHVVRPRSPYGAAKAAGEQFVEAFNRAYGLDAIILRPFSVYGPRLSPQSLVGRILRQARSGTSVCVSDVRPVRDYCYVDDLADAVVRACWAKVDSCILNVGTGRGTSVRDLVRAAAGIVDHDLSLEETGIRQRTDSAEILHLVADATKAAEVLDWRAATLLESGLRQTMQWLEQSDAF